MMRPILLRLATLPGLVFLLACSSGVPGQGDDEFRIVVYRDTWGVPHIFAHSVQAGCYAMGWAQAEDRPEELLKNFLRGMGEVSSVVGEDEFEGDLTARIWDHYGAAVRNSDRIEESTISSIRAFVRGIQDYYESHPEDLPEWWGERRLDEYMVIAFGRHFLYSWSISQGFADLGRVGVQPGFRPEGRGSNQFAVSPERSAEGAAILVIDPHLSWWGASRFWEFRIHAGKLKGSGLTLPGFPTIGLGHNEHLAWAMTTGGPDTADVYELKLNPKNPLQYLYDGTWRDLRQRPISIQVRGEPEPRQLTILDSEHGPVVAVQDGKAYALKMAYAEEVSLLDAWFEFTFGEDYQAAVRAAETLQLFPQNVMVADTSGNIFYQRTGRVPKRPEGYDWSRPVDGSTSKTEWLGFHEASDLVQILNPEQGYMQNCNIPPDAMMAGSPLTPDKYLAYVYSDPSYGPPAGWSNPRGARAVELLAGDDSVTSQDAIDFILDVRPYGVDRWLNLLKQVREQLGNVPEADLQEGLRDLLSWDGRLDRGSTGALKYYYWRKNLADVLGESAERELRLRVDDYRASLGEERPLAEFRADELKAAATALSLAMKELRADHDSLQAVYGDVFRVGREDRSWPVGGGGSGRFGLTTLRNVDYVDPRTDRTRWGRHGQTATQVVVLSNPIQSWSAVPIGQSDRPGSPHFRDQAEKLFSARQLKPTWWQPGELQGHIESRTVLEEPR